MPEPIFKIERMFFDSEKVLKAIGRAKAKALSKAGSFVRRRMRSSMKSGGKKGKTAEPGKPPRTHVGKLKDLVFFAYADGGVVVGPEKFKAGIVPHLLEEGGTETHTGKRGKPITYSYPGNPFARPALEAEVAAGTIPAQFENSL